MQLHCDALNDAKAVLFVEQLQDELADCPNLTVRMLETVLEHFLDFVEGVLICACALIVVQSCCVFPLCDDRLEVKRRSMDQAESEKDLLVRV